MSARAVARRLELAGLLPLALLAAAPARSAVHGQVDVSADVHARVLGVDVASAQVARVGSGVTLRFDEISDNLDVTAWFEPVTALQDMEEHVPAGYPVFALATAQLLDGSRTEPRDLLSIDSKLEDVEVIWSGANAGVPDGAAIDAAAEDGGDLLLSFDVTVALDGLVVDDEDIVRWSVADGWVEVLDLADFGVPSELDLDGLELRSSGALWLSFDGSGEIEGIFFDDDDVLELAPATASWRKVLDGADDLGLADGADLDALGVPPLIFRDGFETGNTSRWSQAAP